MDKVKTRIYKDGNNLAITLDKSILINAQIDIGDEVICYVENEQVIIEKSSQSLQKHLKNGVTYDEKEFSWGEPLGREL